MTTVVVNDATCLIDLRKGRHLRGGIHSGVGRAAGLARARAGEQGR